MRKSFVVMAAVAVVALAWAGVRAQQEMLPRPGPGSGVTPVSAVQRGDWQVSISSMPDVRVSNAVPLRGPSFLKAGTYKITWPNGDEETLALSPIAELVKTGRGDQRIEPSDEGWMEVRRSGSAKRWINVMAARSIEEAR